MNPEPPPASHLPPEVAQALESLSRESTLQSAEQVEAAALVVMQEAVRFVAANPSPDQALETQLEAALETFDWRTALDRLEQLIAAATARADGHLVFRRQQEASQLLQALGRPEAALAAARAATEAARGLAEMPVLAGSALQNEAGHRLQTGDAAGALDCAEASLACLGNDVGARLARSRVLVTRARCQIALDRMDGAAADLEEARPVLERMGDSQLLAGAQAGLAAWHEARARFLLARGESGEAVTHQQAAVERRRRVCAAPQVAAHVSGPALARSLATLAGLLADADEPAAATAARDEATAILRALKLPAPEP